MCKIPNKRRPALLAAVIAVSMLAAACGVTADQKASALSPEAADDLYRQAHKFIEQNEASNAKPLLAEVLASRPDHVRALFDRGMIALHEDRLGEASADLDRAAALAPKDARVLGGQCVVLVAAGRTQQGLDVCDEAVAAGGDGDANAFTARGQALLMTGQDREALADFEEALRLNPRHARARYGQGVAQHKLGDTLEGQRNMDRATQALPGASREFTGLARQKPKS